MNEKLKKYNRIVFILSLVGMIIAIYVTQSFIRKTSIICVNTGCESVRKSPLSYPFGIPVPAFGLVGYAFLAVFSFLRTTKENKLFLKIMMGIATFGISFVSWFTYTELFIIKAICTWCAVSALNMYVIFFLTLASTRFKPATKK